MEQSGTLPGPSVDDEAKLSELQRIVSDTSLRAMPFFMPLTPNDCDSEWDNLPIQNNPPSKSRDE